MEFHPTCFGKEVPESPPQSISPSSSLIHESISTKKRKRKGEVEKLGNEIDIFSFDERGTETRSRKQLRLSNSSSKNTS
jgi:hypothetical protein